MSCTPPAPLQAWFPSIHSPQHSSSLKFTVCLQALEERDRLAQQMQQVSHLQQQLAAATEAAAESAASAADFQEKFIRERAVRRWLHEQLQVGLRWLHLELVPCLPVADGCAASLELLLQQST